MRQAMATATKVWQRTRYLYRVSNNLLEFNFYMR